MLSYNIAATARNSKETDTTHGLKLKRESAEQICLARMSYYENSFFALKKPIEKHCSIVKFTRTESETYKKLMTSALYNQHFLQNIGFHDNDLCVRK